MEPKNPSEPSFAQRVEEALLQVPPGHRVVSASGELSSRSFRQEQARRLRAEGVEVVEFRVDLSRYGWDGRSRS